jgi:DNA repair protein RecN (Recombination protein N)
VGGLIVLTELSVRNLALLEDARLEFAPGFLVLTGETGAGKSILLDALGLALGRRADPGQIRQGADRLSVAVRFRLSGQRLSALLKELGLEGDDDALVLRREVDAGGKSRAFVNDHPVSAATLARLGERLVFIHGQNEHQLLLKASEQRDAVDDFGSLEAERAAVAAAHGAWRAAVEERDALALSEQERSQRLDLYRFQKQELDQADPRPEEEAELEGRLPQLKNAARLREVAQEAHGVLTAQESSAVDLLRRVQRDVETLRGLGAPLGDEADLLAGALIPLEEVSRRLEAYADGLESDPAKLDALLGRLDALAKLKRKYGPTLADVVAHRRRVEEALGRLDNLEGRGAGRRAAPGRDADGIVPPVRRVERRPPPRGEKNGDGGAKGIQRRGVAPRPVRHRGGQRARHFHRNRGRPCDVRFRPEPRGGAPPVGGGRLRRGTVARHAGVGKRRRALGRAPGPHFR